MSQTKPNPRQKQAINIKAGPALVVAGAGTGKTKVIVERIVQLIKGGLDPRSIVALTFTQKAAMEMMDRVNELRGGYNFDLKVMTYNAFGEELLRRFAVDIGLNSNLKLMEEASQLVFLREHIDELRLDYYSPITNPEGYLADMAAYFSQLKQNVVSPSQYRKFADKLPDKTKGEKLERVRHMELVGAFDRYVQLCKRYNVIDYDDQLYLSLELFHKRPNVLKKVQEEINFLLVDEFQDTNAMQSDFLDAVAKPKQNIMVVGDDDQSIYGWRGATLDNILSFKRRYPKSKEVVLTKNYRSTQAILDASYKLITNNNPYRLEVQHGFDKHLVAEKNGKPPQLKVFATNSDEMDFIAADIKNRIDIGQSPGSIAVLARSHATLGRMHDYLDACGIEHNVAGLGHDLYLQPVITDLIYILRAIADTSDNTSVYQALISLAFDDVGPGQLSPLSARARSQHLRLIDLAIDSDDEAIASAGQQILSWHEQSGSRTVSQTLFSVFEDRIKPWLFRLKAEPDGEALAVQTTRDIKEFFDIMRDFERVATRTTVRGFVENIETLKAAGQSVADDSYQLDNQAINLLTIHKAKGLEWDTVYIINLVQGSFPSTSSRSGLELPAEIRRASQPADDNLLEERRLMYVAMTRAAKDLLLTTSERLRHGGNRQRPSIFLTEIFGELEAEIQPGLNHKQTELILPRKHQLPTAKLPTSMQKGQQLVLSASQIETYVFCPLNFYYKYVLNWPEEPSSAAGIGQAMHETAARINASFLDGKPLTEAQAQQMLEENWPEEGFKSSQARNMALAKSKKSIADYLQREKSAKAHPDLIEENFSLSLDNGKIRVNGRFDAVYSRPPVEIRDYKTGEVTDQETADKRADKSYQLGIYALAWQNATGQIPAELTLDFVTSGFIGRSTRTQRRVDNTRDKIIEIVDKIKRNEFSPKGRHDICIHPPLNKQAGYPSGQ